MQAKDIMKRNVIFAKENEKIANILKKLMENNISGVPVIDEHKEVIGILTEQDLVTNRRGVNIPSYIEFVQSILDIDGELQYQKKREQIIKFTAKDMMSTPVYTVSLETSVEEIVSIMINRRINHIPVVDKNHKLAGIIGRSDLLPLLIN